MQLFERSKFENRAIEDARDWWHEQLEMKYNQPWNEIQKYKYNKNR